MNKKLASLFIGTFFVLAASLSMGAANVSAAGMSVTTDASPTVSGTTATLTGSYTSTGSGNTSTYFRWGTTTSLGATTTAVSSTNLSGTMSATLSGLTPGATYYYQAFALNDTAGPGHGATLSFTDGSATTPSADTMSFTSTSTTATLSGSYNGNGSPTVETEFAWGTSQGNLLNQTGFVTQSAPHGTFSATITGLTPSTTYYFEAVAKTDYSTVYATEIIPFTTQSGPSGGSCSITSFTASPNPVSSGGAVTLAWTTTGCTYGSIDNAVGTTTPIASGSITGVLFNTTTFTMTAGGNGTTDTATLTVTVNGSGTTGGNGSCVINSFTAAQSSIAYGGATTLSWSLGTGCTSAYITPSIGTVAVGTNSTGTGALYSTTSYTLSASDGTNTVNSYVTVSVQSGGTTGGGTTGSGSSCGISSFTASPSTVNYGGNTTLYWTTYNCASVSISNVGGGFAASGSTITPTLVASTYYTLTATDYYGGTTTDQLFVGVTNGGTNGYGTTGGYNGSCTINSFVVSPSTVTEGQSATITWSSNGCTGLSLSGGNMYSTFEPASGSITTGPLSGTTTFSLYGNGDVSTSQQAIAYVTNSPYPYQYTCQSGDYTDPSCSGQYAGSFITIPATNIGSTTARLNGIANNISTPFVGYFEYGTTASLGQATVFQNTSPVQSYNFYDTIPTYPNTTYYYRAAGQINGTIIRGNILSFTTPSSSSTDITYVGGSSSSDTSSSTASSGSSTTTAAPGVNLTITDPNDNVTVGDTVEYTATYTNNTSKTLTNSILTVILPQGFTVTQTTQGIMVNQTTVTVNIGTLAPAQTGSIFIEAKVDPNVATGQTLVTNGTLAYTLPNGTHDSAVGYVLNHASSENVLAGFALGSGFFPSTIWGWFFTIIIILIIILIARRIAKQKHGADHGHDAHGAHGPAKH